MNYAMTATEMDGTLHTDLQKSEKCREIKRKNCSIWTSLKVVLIFKIRREMLKNWACAHFSFDVLVAINLSILMLDRAVESFLNGHGYLIFEPRPPNFENQISVECSVHLCSCPWSFMLYIYGLLSFKQRDAKLGTN